MKFRFASARLSLLLVVWLAAVTTAAAQKVAPGEELLPCPAWQEAAGKLAPESLAHLQIVDAPHGMSGQILKISNPGAGPLQVNILTISNPPITTETYALRARIRYEDVTGDGYLEMWNHFSNGNRYFSRTLGDKPSDPAAKLSGTSDWRWTVLPFYAQGANGHPEELTVNVVLPGKGTVYLTPFQLFQVRSQ